MQTAVSITTWLGVGGMTGGAGGLILGGLAVWRTLRRPRDPPAKVTPPPVVTIDSPPPPHNARSIALAERLGARHENNCDFLGKPCRVYRHPGEAA